MPQSGSQLDLDGQRISHSAKGVQLAANLHEANVRPSPAEQNYSSFWIEITNQRNVLLPLSATDFLLIDDQGRQYQAADPEALVEQLAVSVPYLTPYPYVGYYYLQDSVRSQLDNQLRSETNFFSSRRPEYIASEALPEASVSPGAKVAGAIYFPVELRTLTGFQLRYQVGALPGQKNYQISLPFKVEKK
jgi:hypothetical protein